MADQIQKNTFEGGLNTDVLKNSVNANQFIAANNVALTQDGVFFGLTNLKGTTRLQELANSTGADVLGAFRSRYTIDGTPNVECLTIFVYTPEPGHAFYIYAYDIAGDDLYRLYSETVSATYHGESTLVDAVIYPENGQDVIYFTDFQRRPRKLRCNIPFPFVQDFLTSSDLELLRVPALGTIALDTTNGVSVGGSLLTGTYQLSYQLYNEDNNRVSGFSLLTTPIHVYTTPSVVPQAGIGLPSNKRIVVDITPTEQEASDYTHFRLAVVENIGTGTTPTNVGVTNWEPIVLSSGVIQDYEITSNTQYESVTLDEIVIDLAAIEKVKTLAVQNNRLFLGNVQIAELAYDNGDVGVVGGGSIVTQNTSSTAANSDLFVSRFKGYFRDEVYRFAISYFDEYGNYSNPVTLDLNAITFNQISGTLPDVKFPERGYYDSGTYFSIMDTANNLRYLGLSITGIDNHPSWAKGFVILRAKRRKNIAFQTPLVPMMRLSGLGAVANYPTIYRDSTNTKITDTTLTPMGPSAVFVPYNFFYGAPTASPGYLTASGGATTNVFVAGEAQPLQYRSTAEYVMMFPPVNIYENNAYPFTGGEQFEAVDAVICETYTTRFDSESYNPGLGAKSSITGTFFSLRDSSQYYNDGHVKSVGALRGGVKIPFKATYPFDNFNVGFTFTGADILDYTKLSTATKPVGTLPTAHRGVVAPFNYSISQSVFSPPSFLAGSPTNKTNSTSTIGSYPNTINNSEFLMTGTGLWEIPATTNLGTWNVVTNSPTVVDGTGTLGDYYTVIGITPPGDPYVRNLGSGNITFYNGDVIRYDGLKWVSNRQGFGYKSNIIEINNVVNGLDDARYGDPDSYNEFIFTGTKVVFTDSEVTTYIQPKASLPKDVTVWGGDCIVAPHTFKLTDSTYTVLNQSKAFNSGEAVSQLATRWLNIWTDAGDNAGLFMPAFVRNGSQYLQVVLESEYNGAVVDWADNERVTTLSGGSSALVYGATSEAQAFLHRPYLYNININKENDQKLFVPIDPLTDLITKYPARILYSDLKLYQTPLEGFDRFPVLNTFDLEERYGDLTALRVVADRLYSLQERAIAALPVGERIIETTDASQLQVRSGDVLGRPMYLDSLRGTQHLASVANTGNTLFMLDNLNKSVLAIDGGQVKIISGNGLSTALRTQLASQFPEKNIFGFYDQIRDHYWVGANTGEFCYIWNNSLQLWETNIVATSGASITKGVYALNNLYLMGKDAVDNDVALHRMYTGNRTNIMGNIVYPLVTFISNPQPDFSKTYNDILLNSNFVPFSVSFRVYRGAAIQNGVLATVLTPRGEGNYKAKIGRNTSGATYTSGAYKERLRGPYLETTITWPSGTELEETLSSVLVKYKLSENTF